MEGQNSEIKAKSSILAVIFYPLLLVAVIAAVLGSTLLPLFIIREVEIKDHQRIERIEEMSVAFLEISQEIGGPSIYDSSFLSFLKNKTGFDVAIYDKEGLIASSFNESQNALKERAPFGQETINRLTEEYQKNIPLPHLHQHFSIGNDIYMISSYALPGILSEPDASSLVFVNFVSSAKRFYDLRNKISFVMALTALALIGTVVAFLMFILKKFVSEPARMIIRAAEEIGKGNLEVALPRVALGEMAHLSDHLSIMIEKLRELREKEKELNQMKTEIISIAAHHLRTPLSALKWGLQTILQGDLGKISSSAQKALLENLYNTNEQMVQVVNDLLDVSRIEEGKFGYNWSYGNLEDIIRESIKETEPRIKKAGLKLIFQKPRASLPKIKIDPSKIQLVIFNLIDNALKYTSSGEIKVSLAYKDLQIIFSVKDDGIGIPQFEQEKIFSKFFRASNIVKSNSMGTGLGLYIAKSIIEKHGGKIWFQSKEGQGSVFSFSLPVEKRFAPKEKYLEFLENI